MSDYLQKAPFNDWWYWSDVLAKRLRTVSEVYKENDERERATEMGGIAIRLTKLFGEVAQKGQRAKTEAEKVALQAEEEAAIFEGTNIWRDMLSSLPFVSEHMEAFQSVEWRVIDPLKNTEAKPNKALARAIELFWGPDGRFDEGIRSGLPADGGLPGILMNMLAAEKSNSNRTPSEYKNEQTHNNYYRAPKGPGGGPGGM